jgi:ABC-type antimicrobial peptide transport system permease subunit
MRTRNQQDAWRDFNSEYVYFLAKPNADMTALRSELASIEKEIYTEKDPVKASFQIQALSDITLGRELLSGLGEQWDLLSMIIFGTLSLLILLPACFNYSNISIARALKRSKEIGLRKTLGSLKQQIFVQFITETVVITVISLILACFIFILIRPEFLSMLVASNKLDLSLTPEMLLGFLLFALLTGLLAGTVPALYFARLNPIQALKSSGSSKTFSVSKVRKGLTVAQFVLSFSFIIGLVVFSKQYRYSLNFDFGFQQANILDVNLQDVPPSNFDTHFSSLASVKNISYSSNILGLGASQTYVKTQEQSDSIEVFQLFVDDQYLDNLGLTLLAGENFSNENHTRESGLIVNEEFLIKHKIATPMDALGKVFVVDSLELPVIGVVKNFHFMSLREPIYSFFFRSNPSQFKYANLNIASTDIDATLLGMERVWKTLSPETKFEAKFFEQEIADSFDTYKVLLKMVGFLGVLAISISCLGLLGMVVYTTEGKTKEVGIRKVMGASAASITYLLSKDYLKLMLIAVVIATPITWLFFAKFLSQLQYYRVTIDVFDVLISIVILMTLGLGAIATQTLRTAATNPAETLKYE